MKRYAVELIDTRYVTVIVEAESEAEALALAPEAYNLTAALSEVEDGGVIEAVCAHPVVWISERLEYLRGEIRAERISYGELAELQALARHIDPHDVELLEWAGVTEDDYRKRLDELDAEGH